MLKGIVSLHYVVKASHPPQLARYPKVQPPFEVYQIIFGFHASRRTHLDTSFPFGPQVVKKMVSQSVH